MSGYTKNYNQGVSHAKTYPMEGPSPGARTEDACSDNDFLAGWPEKLDLVAAVMQSKRDTFESYTNKVEYSQISNFFKDWSRHGDVIKSRWSDVTSGVTHSSQRREDKFPSKPLDIVGQTKSMGSVPKGLPKDFKQIDVENMTKQFEKLSAEIREKERMVESLEETNRKLTDQ